MTEIYNEQMEKIDHPDLALGYLKPSTRTEHHEAIPGVDEQWHYETVNEYPNGGRDVKKVVDVPGVKAQEAWTEEIPIQIYIPYTQAELDAMEDEKNRPTPEQRIAALEQQIEMLLSGVTADE